MSSLVAGIPATELLSMLETEKARRARENKLDFYRPYPKQREFHDLLRPLRLFMASNQSGKTYAGAAEAAYHLTGLYPADWQGHRFEGPTRAWIGAPTNQMIKEGAQILLLGSVDDPGTGTLPKHLILDVTKATGVRELADTITVRHVTGGVSRVSFKTYDQGRERWQAATLDWVWFDEEPPKDIFSEGVTRTNATRGIVWLTFTPLQGMSEVVIDFLQNPSPSRGVVTMTIWDAEHFSEEQRAEIVERTPLHERDARTKGIPMLGSGAVFPVPDEMIQVEPFAIPRHWGRIGGIDIGWDHPTAAVELAHDRDTDCIYVTKEYREKMQIVSVHAGALVPWGRFLPWAWPHDAFIHEKGSGEQIAKLYETHGLRMLGEHAQFADGRGNSTEAGVTEMLDRMQTGRWRVFSTCGGWFQEKGIYHRKDGKIVKQMDDLLSATRHAVMMLRFARTQPAPPDPYARGYRKRAAKGSAMAA